MLSVTDKNVSHGRECLSSPEWQRHPDGAEVPSNKRRFFYDASGFLVPLSMTHAGPVAPRLGSTRRAKRYSMQKPFVVTAREAFMQGRIVSRKQLNIMNILPPVPRHRACENPDRFLHPMTRAAGRVSIGSIFVLGTYVSRQLLVQLLLTCRHSYQHHAPCSSVDSSSSSSHGSPDRRMQKEQGFGDTMQP